MHWTVAKSKLILLAAQQANKLGDEGIVTFIWEAGSPRRQRTSVLENHLAGVWMLFSFIEQRGHR